MESSYYSVSTACMKCGGAQSLDVSHDPACTKCKGSGFVNEYYGGGTEPPIEGVSPVIGTRVENVRCRSGQILHIECFGCGNKYRAEMRLGDD